MVSRLNWVLTLPAHSSSKVMSSHTSDLAIHVRSFSSNALPYSLQSIGHIADPSVQSVSLQVIFDPSLAIGCHYFPPGLRSSPHPKNVTVFWPVSSYTAWWQRHIGVNNLPKVVTQLSPCGNWTHDLLITSPKLYSYATMPHLLLLSNG